MKVVLLRAPASANIPRRDLLTELCAARSWEIVGDMVPAAALAAAARGGFEGLMAWRCTDIVKGEEESKRMGAWGAFLLDAEKAGLQLVFPGSGVDLTDWDASTKLGAQLAFAFDEHILAVERELLAMRTRAGIASARTNGRKIGRPSVLVGDRIAEARELLVLDPALSAKILGQRLGVSEGTAFKVRKMIREGRAG